MSEPQYLKPEYAKLYKPVDPDKLQLPRFMREFIKEKARIAEAHRKFLRKVLMPNDATRSMPSGRPPCGPAQTN